MKMRNFARRGFEVGLSVAAAVGFHRYVGSPGVVQGASMLPTFPACCAVVWFSCIFRRLDIGDVISASSPGSGDETVGIVKRIRGVAGDVIFDEESGNFVVVPEGHLWILGDNPAESRDSRSYGPIPISSVHAKVMCTLWPIPKKIPSLPQEELDRIRVGYARLD